MAELPAYHGRTHAVGGSDPIPFPSTSATKAATFRAGLRSFTIAAGSTADITFDILTSNDPSFSYLVTSGTPKRAKYIEITEEGLYLCQGTVFWSDSTPFSGAQNPYIELSVYYPSIPTSGLLINAGVGVLWDDGQGPITGEQTTSDDYAHSQMMETVWFNFNKTDMGENSVGIGVLIGTGSTGGSVTKSIGGCVMVAKLGDLMTDTTVT